MRYAKPTDGFNSTAPAGFSPYRPYAIRLIESFEAMRMISWDDFYTQRVDPTVDTVTNTKQNKTTASTKQKQEARRSHNFNNQMATIAGKAYSLYHYIKK